MCRMITVYFSVEKIRSLNNCFSLNRFAVVVVGSDNSSRLIFEKLPKKEIHGQVPQISNCNRQALSQFEAQARKGDPPAQNGRQSTQLTPDDKIINDLNQFEQPFCVNFSFSFFKETVFYYFSDIKTHLYTCYVCICVGKIIKRFC